MPAATVASASHASTRADIITSSLETGLPIDLDVLAETSDPARRFLRRAWYQADATSGLCTLVARRRDGTPLIVIPTRPVGPKILRARSVACGYWPFRSFPVAQHITDAEIKAFLECAIVRKSISTALRIGPVYADDPGVSRIVSVAQTLGWAILNRNLGTSFLQDVAAQGANGSCPGKSRIRKTRGYARKLEQAHGSIDIRIVCGEDWNAGALDVLAAIEAASWVGTRTDRSGAKFLNPGHLRHWRTVVTDPFIAANLRATILYAGGEPIAFSFDLRGGDVLYGIASSYREDMARFSPGQIVTTRLLEDSLAMGIRSIDWGSGDTGYKRALGAEPGSQIVDLMLVRNPVLAAAVKPQWETSHHSAGRTLAKSFAASLGEISRMSAVRAEHVLLPGIALAAAVAAINE